MTRELLVVMSIVFYMFLLQSYSIFVESRNWIPAAICLVCIGFCIGCMHLNFEQAPSINHDDEE